MSKKRKMSEQERSENMRHVAAVLMCPHRWGETKDVRVVSPDGKKKPFDGKLSVCAICGTNRVDHHGISSMYPPQGLSQGRRA